MLRLSSKFRHCIGSVHSCCHSASCFPLINTLHMAGFAWLIQLSKAHSENKTTPPKLKFKKLKSSPQTNQACRNPRTAWLKALLPALVIKGRPGIRTARSSISRKRKRRPPFGHSQEWVLKSDHWHGRKTGGKSSKDPRLWGCSDHLSLFIFCRYFRY